jgi:UPF0716 protein FxsA
MWLFAAFVAVPILEIALFIQVGGWLGLWPTLLIVVATAALGTVLVRRQGLEQVRRVQRAFDRLSDPTEPLAHGAMILVAGVLLLTPGFFTDAVGFALLVPGVRRAALAWAKRRVSARFVMARGTQERPGPGPRPAPRGGDVVEGEWTELRPAPGAPGAERPDAAPEPAPTPARAPSRPVERPRDAGPSGWTRPG